MKKKIIGVFIAIALLGVGLSAIPVMANVANHLDHVQITPTSATLAVGGIQQFSAQAYDDNNQPIANVNYFWLVVAGGGTINTTGLFTAGSVPGTYSNTVEVVAVQGTTVKLASATVTVTGTPGPLDHIQVTPASATIVPGGTQQFAAQGYDLSNIPIQGLTFTWSVVAGGGTINSTTGSFTAGTATSTFPNTILATLNGGTKTGMATVIVSTTPPPTTIPTKLDINRLVSMFKGYLKSSSFDNFLGGQWQVKNGTGTDIIKVIPGIVQTASATSLTVTPNGQTSPSTFTLTTSTVIQPKNAVFVANDKVVVVTVNDQISLVVKIATPSTSEQPPGLKKQDDNKQEGKDTPPGWSHGKKVGWSNNQRNNNNQNSKGHED